MVCCTRVTQHCFLLNMCLHHPNPQLKLTHANNKMKAAEHAHRKELRAAQAAVAAQKQEIAELRRNLSAAEAAGKMSQQLQFVASQVWGCGGGAAVSAQ